MGISSFIKWVINIIIGLIVSVYLIYDKDNFISGTKKVLKAILPDKIYDTTMTTLGYVDKIFGGFMIAKIIDSILVGILTFIILAIFKIPYALIIAVIVGITNIIPYFGPFIGAIPCAVLLLLIDPAKSLTFTILILLIQQFDGNILGPKLIGNRTGIKSFWVLFSILLFGGLFGFVGMIFGVPVFAVIYSVFANLLNKKLAKKKEA
jgi:predicted PurR-regulated permease PerM